MDYEFYRLKNGVRVMLVPMPGVESLAVGVYIGTGSRYETPGINGISHFLEHMVFKGTKKFPTHKETSYLEGLGAIQNAWTSVDATCYYCKIPANRWREGLEVVKELALYPVIPPADLEIERGVILEEINRRDDRPDELAGEVLQNMMFAPNPLGMTVLGEPKVIKGVSRDDFMEYHRRQYVSKNAVVVMAGKIDGAGAGKQIEEWFGDLAEREPTPYAAVTDKQTAPEVKIKRKKLAAQAHIELAVRGLTVSDPDRFALGVLTSYLGQGLSSRLFVEVREKLGLCYAIRASDDLMPDTGVWSVYAGLNVAKLEEALKAILAELGRVKSSRLSEEELTAAKEKVRGPILFSKENPLHQMDFYGRQALERPGEILSYDQVIERVMTVDAEMIRNVSQRLFKQEKINLAVVAPLPVGEEDRLAALLQL